MQKLSNKCIINLQKCVICRFNSSLLNCQCFGKMNQKFDISAKSLRNYQQKFLPPFLTPLLTQLNPLVTACPSVLSYNPLEHNNVHKNMYEKLANPVSILCGDGITCASWAAKLDCGKNGVKPAMLLNCLLFYTSQEKENIPKFLFGHSQCFKIKFNELPGKRLVRYRAMQVSPPPSGYRKFFSFKKTKKRQKRKICISFS